MKVPVVTSIFLACAACVASQGPVATNDQLNCPNDKLQALARDCDLLLVGKVVSVMESPRSWGYHVSYQGVEYQIESLIKGQVVGPQGDGRIRVRHLITRSTTFLNPDEPGLSAVYYRPGARFILFLNRDPGHLTYHLDGGDWKSEYVVLEESCSAIPYTDDRYKLIAALVNGTVNPS